MSTKEYGCFFCSGKSIREDGICDECGKPIGIGAQLVGIPLEEYKTESVIGRGYYGWTLKVQDRYLPYAIKIIPQRRSQGRAIPDSEEQALAQCSVPTHRNIARFIRQFPATIALKEGIVDVRCLVFEFVPDAIPLAWISTAQYSPNRHGQFIARTSFF